jgi:hypothetical protein
MTLTEKAKIYYNVWCCAYQRRSMYRGTAREQREHDTILMCLNMKDAQWYQFDSEKPKY